MSIPNILTILRLLLIPVFGYYLCQEAYVIAALVFILAGLTDILDGYIARKFDMVTSWGKIADPAADKLMMVTALVVLTILNKIKLYVVIIVVVKESLMALGGLLIYRNKKIVVSANWYGKISTAVFNIAIVLLILGVPHGNIIIAVAIITMLFAFLMYLRKYFKMGKVAHNGR